MGMKHIESSLNNYVVIGLFHLLIEKKAVIFKIATS